MGTRADFYVGKGKDAEWLGSIAWDGYRDGIDDPVLNANSEAAFRSAVETFLAGRNDATHVADGWPWPWDTSATSDCSYWFFDSQCWEAAGYPTERFYPCSGPSPVNDEGEYPTEGYEVVEFPDMSAKKNITLGRRSGLIILTG